MRSALFIITALAISYQTLVHMVMVVCGSVGLDTRPARFPPFIGAALLIFSALVPIRFAWIRWISLLACAVPWLYFGPGIYLYFFSILGGEDYFDIVILLPALLLLVSTIYCLFALLKYYRNSKKQKAAPTLA
jgi:hypothetical protein